MKKIILVILILIISTIVSGCGKPTQHVSGDGGGERSFSVKLKKK